jgi:type VI secretion system protein ImpB
MPREASLQHKLDRVRRPRVQITYDVETNGSPIKKELPFVLGVMADLSGHPDPDKDHEQLAQREFTEINRDNFNRVMTAIAPRLALSVPNQIQKDGSKLGVVLNFQSLDDFDPENVVRHVEPLKQLLEAREKLADLKTKVVSNDKLDAVLQKVIQHTEDLKKKTGGTPAAASGDQGTSAGEGD